MAFSFINIKFDNKTANILPAKKTHSIRFYTGGINIKNIKKYSKKSIDSALKKRWQVIYSHRNPDTEKLQVKNRIFISNDLQLKERIEMMKEIELSYRIAIKNGYSPYDSKLSNLLSENKAININEALDFALNQKIKEVNKNTYSTYESHVKAFKSFLKNNNANILNSNEINRKIANSFLNEVLEKTSARNRNNHRSSLSAIFTTLLDNEMVSVNHFKQISNLNTEPVDNRPFTEAQVIKIAKFLKEKDPQLLLFIKFISYNFLRPGETSFLQAKDFYLEIKNLRIPTKTGFQTRLIPEILFKELDFIAALEPEDYIFTPNGKSGKWEVSDVHRRQFFSKRFTKIVKKEFKLSEEYTIYSFRHTFVTDLVRQIMKQGYTFDEALRRSMPITGHSSIDGIKNYVRNINAVLPEDYSDIFSIKL